MTKHYTVIVEVKAVTDAETRTDRYGKPEAEVPRTVRDVAHVVTSADTELAALLQARRLLDTLAFESAPKDGSQ